MAEVADVNDQSFESEVVQADKPAVVDFWAEWCAPCRQIAPIIQQIAEEHGDRIKVVKVDVDTSPGTAGKYGVRSIPTVLGFRNGQVVEQLVGARPRPDFEAMVAKLLE